MALEEEVEKTKYEIVKDTLDEDFTLMAGNVRTFLPILKDIMLQMEDLELRIIELEGLLK